MIEQLPSLTVYLPENMYARIVYLSMRRKVPIRELVKRWINEKLEEEEKKEVSE